MREIKVILLRGCVSFLELMDGTLGQCGGRRTLGLVRAVFTNSTGIRKEEGCRWHAWNQPSRADARCGVEYESNELNLV